MPPKVFSCLTDALEVPMIVPAMEVILEGEKEALEGRTPLDHALPQFIIGFRERPEGDESPVSRHEGLLEGYAPRTPSQAEIGSLKRKHPGKIDQGVGAGEAEMAEDLAHRPIPSPDLRDPEGSLQGKACRQSEPMKMIGRVDHILSEGHMDTKARKTPE